MVGCVESACVGMAAFSFVNFERDAAGKRCLATLPARRVCLTTVTQYERGYNPANM
jgi:hypothetical protein